MNSNVLAALAAQGVDVSKLSPAASAAIAETFENAVKEKAESIAGSRKPGKQPSDEIHGQPVPAVRNRVRDMYEHFGCISVYMLPKAAQGANVKGEIDALVKEHGLNTYQVKGGRGRPSTYFAPSGCNMVCQMAHAHFANARSEIEAAELEKFMSEDFEGSAEHWASFRASGVLPKTAAKTSAPEVSDEEVSDDQLLSAGDLIGSDETESSPFEPVDFDEMAEESGPLSSEED